MTQVFKARRAKGEQTRRTILLAALRIIADQGLKALTHRALANEAAVNLSLTTYYFKDLSTLVRAAFEHFRQQSLDLTLPHPLFAFIREQGEGPLPKAQRATHCQQFVALADDYVWLRGNAQRQQLVLELVFLHDPHLPPALRQSAAGLFNRHRDDYARFCAQLGSNQPELDGELLLASVQHLECQALGDPEVLTTRDTRASLARLLGWIAGGNA